MESKDKIENPPAFPNTDGETFCNDGMTLRDYFAAKAMQATITNQVAVEEHIKEADEEEIDLGEYLAKTVYAIADAMLKERGKQ
jgi:hypothetical protein